MNSNPKIAFFGTPDIAVMVLEELHIAGITPQLIVTNPDKPQGRGLELTFSPVKQYAVEHDIPVFQPELIANDATLAEITNTQWDLFVVVAYGLILPKWFIDLPKHGTINLHPSMLPKLRGASPIRTSLLQDLQDVGITIMLMDEKMDHGPILAQKPVPLPFPLPGTLLDEILAHQGGSLLAETIPKWIAGEIVPQEQDHAEATYSKKITKQMGELELDPFNLPKGEAAHEMYLKICAFDGWPGSFFFYNGKRIKITDAFLAGGSQGVLEIYKVIPEGKKEMEFAQFLQSIKN
jgi:methionyl-tRNA formyltransferase